MVSRRRRPSWPRRILLLVAVLLVLYFLYSWIFGGDGNDDVSAVENGATTSQTDNPSSAAPVNRNPPKATLNTPVPTPTPAPAPQPQPRVDNLTPPPTLPPTPSPTPSPSPATLSTPTPTPTPTPSPAFPPSPPDSVTQDLTFTDPDVTTAAQLGLNLIAQGELIDGRRDLSRILVEDDDRLSAADAQVIRDTLWGVNQQLLFSKTITPGDPVAFGYKVESGDFLSVIARKVRVPYPFLEQINKTPANRIRAGQTLKLVRGPFHAIVDKSDFRMDLFLRDENENWIYARSYPVGLGQDDSTPVGAWIIRPRSKVKNPSWANPRTGKAYRADDPANPIGEYWLGLQGIDDNTRDARSYGIHGTIEPDSVGRQASLGCIRLLDDDIRDVFGMLYEGESTVLVRP